MSVVRIEVSTQSRLDIVGHFRLTEDRCSPLHGFGDEDEEVSTQFRLDIYWPL
jgi:hypothetical protein